MKDFILLFFITVIYVAFKGTVISSAPLPDIPLIIVFLLSYGKPSLKDIPLCFILGFTVDALSGGFTGLTSFTLITVYALNYITAVRVHYDNALLRGAGAGIASLLSGTLSYFIISSFNDDIHYFPHVVPAALLTAAFAPLIIALLLKAMSFKTFSREEGETF